jgi:hypothetical protein
MEFQLYEALQLIGDMKERWRIQYKELKHKIVFGEEWSGTLEVD